ncbi:DEAD/DEAH box helicase [Actinopolymorpha pittospori]
MNRYSSEPVMTGLKDFQRATVDHVIDRFFGEQPTRRFLVADEAGLGKSIVARGVIAKLHERLQDDDTIDRVDIIYVCSNQDIAKQNLARLKVTPDESITPSSRLTMLARHSKTLQAAKARAGKPLNLVAFTPGTSFDRGWRTGKAEERAMLFLLLEAANQWDGWSRRAALRALQATARLETLEHEINHLENDLQGEIDRQISKTFLREARRGKLLSGFNELIDDIGRRTTLPQDLKERASKLTGEMRATLARAGVQTLEPDLVILDEFQRFRHLLDRSEGGEAAELAHHLFEYGQTKTLLLSATPYKPFTLAEEAALGEDHHSDFRRTLSFLRDDPQWNADVTVTFDAYRTALVKGGEVDGHRDELRGLLLRVMTRTERPAEVQARMHQERRYVIDDLRVTDVRGYAALSRVARLLDAPSSIEYWKSAPYFLNFTEGYKLGEKLRAALRDQAQGELDGVLSSAQLLDVEAMRRYAPVDLGNGRLRQLAADTVNQGWWKLLWLPPSMPHYSLGEPFNRPAEQGITKRLLFSSWTATPTAVAGLLSYEVERRLADGRLRRNDPAERRRVATRLDYRLDGTRPGAMSTLALFWPHPVLAALCDPLTLARARADRVPNQVEIEDAARNQILQAAGSRPGARDGDVPVWSAFFRWPGAALPEDLSVSDAVAALSGQSEEDADGEPTRLERHVDLAMETTASDERIYGGVDGAMGDLVALAMHGPGNIAWRALGRLVGTGDAVTQRGHWRAAATLAGGMRSLFNRLESTLLLDHLDLDPVHWRAVLRYCAVGGLQAVLDEYLHHLRASSGEGALDDGSLFSLAQAAGEALSVRPSTYQAFDPANPETPIRLLSRFALRYGGRRDDSEGARQPEVRNAFNSPFWPFVLATTSAGQEGIDFHWWCSAVVHWNTPANPVDFEQREGRVHRFGGHAVRRNVAACYRSEALRSSEPDVWKAAYDVARSESGPLGDFAPYWVYPGRAKIERHVMPYVLSRDIPKLDRLKDELALYRLAFGQPRQEDLVALLQRAGVGAEQAASAALTLTPPDGARNAEADRTALENNLVARRQQP